MSKRENLFNELVRRVRKDHFGKGPERIKTVFVENMAISTLHGNLTPVEKFLAQTPEGAEMIHAARTKMIQKIYRDNPPVEMESVVGSKLLHLFSDIHVADDMAISVFIFENKIEDE